MSDVVIEVDADVEKYNKAIGGLEKSTQGMMSKAQGASGALLGGVAVAAAGVVGLGVASVGAAEEAAVANQRLDQIYKQQGDTQGKLAGKAKAYADELSKQIGIDDEIIKGAQAKLATFSNVSGSAETMARATTLAADLSAAGFGDMSGTSLMLGKALQDPVKGITAMGRAGVTFSEDQKEMIKSLVESGDVAGAQAIIFGEVEKQVGGVAGATVTDSQKMAVAWGEVQESLGSAFMPIANIVMPALTNLANKVSEFFAGDWQAKLKELAPIFYIIGGAILAGMVPALWAMATAAIAAITPLLPFLAIGAAIGAAVYLIVNALGGWSNAWKVLKSAFASVWAFLKPAWEAMKAFAIGVFNGIKASITNNMGLIKATIRVALNVIKSIWNSAWAIIKVMIVPIWNAIKTTITTVINTIKGVLKAVMQIITGDWKGAWETIKSTVSGLIGGLGKIARNIGTAIWNGLKAGVANIGPKLLNLLKSAAKGAFDAFKAVFGINSPAAEMTWAIEMLAKGADKGMPKLNKSLSQISGMVAGVIPDSIAGGTTGGAVINYTQNINTPVTSYGEVKRAERDFSSRLAGGFV